MKRNLTAGVVSNAFYMESSGGYCDIARSPDLNVGMQGAEGFTLEAWVKRTDNTAAPIFEWGSSSETFVTR